MRTILGQWQHRQEESPRQRIEVLILPKVSGWAEGARSSADNVDLTGSSRSGPQPWNQHLSKRWV